MGGVSKNRQSYSSTFVKTNHLVRNRPPPEPMVLGDVDFSAFNASVKRKKQAAELMCESPGYFRPKILHANSFVEPQLLLPPDQRLIKSAEFTSSQKKRRRNAPLLSPDPDSTDDLDLISSTDLMDLLRNHSSAGSTSFFIV